MYSIGDYLVHPGQGVCRVEDIAASPSATYVLLPLGQRRPVHISFPVASEGRLRPVLSRDEAEKILDGYEELAPVSFAARNIALEEEHYRSEIRSGSCELAVRIAKTFRERIASLIESGKKPPVAYDRILKLAQERSSSELAVALGCSAEEVMGLMCERMEEAS